MFPWHSVSLLHGVSNVYWLKWAEHGTFSLFPGEVFTFLGFCKFSFHKSTTMNPRKPQSHTFSPRTRTKTMSGLLWIMQTDSSFQEPRWLHRLLYFRTSSQKKSDDASKASNTKSWRKSRRCVLELFVAVHRPPHQAPGLRVGVRFLTPTCARLPVTAERRDAFFKLGPWLP